MCVKNPISCLLFDCASLRRNAKWNLMMQNDQLTSIFTQSINGLRLSINILIHRIKSCGKRNSQHSPLSAIDKTWLFRDAFCSKQPWLSSSTFTIRKLAVFFLFALARCIIIKSNHLIMLSLTGDYQSSQQMDKKNCAIELC